MVCWPHCDRLDFASQLVKATRLKGVSATQHFTSPRPVLACVYVLMSHYSQHALRQLRRRVVGALAVRGSLMWLFDGGEHRVSTFYRESNCLDNGRYQ